ncbi:MAG: FAD binding domain-containing protein [Microbacterium sp.]|nr:FAD binding domain-containing protein [Microbacterium sp.]
MDVTSVDEVLMCADPREWRVGDSWLAGGTVIYSYGTDITRGAPRRLLDITGAGWQPLTWHRDADGALSLEIASTCRIADLRALADDPTPGGVMRAELPGLDLIPPVCDSFVASWKIWHVSTVGGNVATALPAGPMISLLTAWDATALILRPDGRRRRARVADLVVGPAKTRLGYGELIRSFLVPAESLRQQAAFRRISLTERGRSAALLIGRRTSEQSLRLSVTASVFRPVMLDIAADDLSAGIPPIPAADAPLDIPPIPIADAPPARRRPTVATSAGWGVGGQVGRRRGESAVRGESVARGSRAVRADAAAWRTAIDVAAGRWYDDIHGEPEWRRRMTHRLGDEILAELLPGVATGVDDAVGRVTGDLRMERTTA